MKLNALVVALTLAMPVAAMPQHDGSEVTPAMRDALATMERNVGQIAFKPEKERWQANVDLWKVRIENQGKLSKEEFKTMEPVFTTMEENVSRLIEPQEKERWTANHAMWQVAMGISGLDADGQAAKVAFTLSVMQANVARIKEPDEKERWTANLALWRGMYDKK